jgi:hypothetical protein
MALFEIQMIEGKNKRDEKEKKRDVRALARMVP